jgi:hypothetical protein
MSDEKQEALARIKKAIDGKPAVNERGRHPKGAAYQRVTCAEVNPADVVLAADLVSDPCERTKTIRGGSVNAAAEGAVAVALHVVDLVHLVTEAEKSLPKA